MPSLLVVVFLLQLVIHLINTVGASTINNLLWILYNKFPTSISTSVQRQSKLRAEIVGLKREMNATSSQDQFAKWARLRRQHDKAVAEYDQKSSSTQSFKSTFDSAISIARWFGTNGLRLLLQFWFAKQPLFWIPRGWAPWYVEWLLAFPRAPTGSVSIQVWGIACVTMIQLVTQAAVAGWALMGNPRHEEKREGMKMSSSSAGGNGKVKKEL